MAERGYSKDLHRDAPAGRGCGCPEDFEHDGKCQNALRERKAMMCIPCSQNWHHPFPCPAYVSKAYPIYTTQCELCGWDSAEHPISAAEIRKIRDSRIGRDDAGRYPGWKPGD